VNARAWGASLDARWVPAACGLVAAYLVHLTWGRQSIPIMHDEWAYWTQAGQYAALHWSVPAPPIPEFFEQLYVLVSPVFAAKYWPGHALTLAPGFMLGVPALMPLVLTAATGALVFALARRTAGGRVAAVTFVLWVSTFGNLRFRATYFSELTTSCAWLVAWWALLEWRETRRWPWMVLLAAATGWGAISRPPTMLLFAIPVGVVVIRDAIRSRAWSHLALGVAVGTAILAILPLWSARVTGDWRTTPMASYTRQYLPFDLPGYDVDATPPTRELPVEMERVRGFLRDIKTEQASAPVWLTFTGRAGLLLRDAFDGWRLPFAVAFAFGLFTAGAVGWFVFGTSLLLVAGYLTQAHTADWSIYYLETYPAIAFVTALGVRAIWRRVATDRGLTLPRWTFAALAIAAMVLIGYDLLGARHTLSRVAAHTRDFRAGVAALDERPNIVFVRYAEPSRRNMHISLVANDGDLEHAESWIVHDRGADDLRLMDAAPGRTPYLYDEAKNEFYRVKR
jgi:hypothetical protein